MTRGLPSALQVGRREGGAKVQKTNGKLDFFTHVVINGDQKWQVRNIKR
jgi:hypothetical protein